MRFRNTILSGLCIAAAFAAAACSGNALSSPTALLGTSLSSTSAGGTRAVTHFIDPEATGMAGHADISCSSEAPRIYRSDVVGNRVDLQWQQVFNATKFELEVERQDVENAWLPFRHDMVTNPVRAEFYAGEGRYRMRVRNATCTQPGLWSVWAEESISQPLPQVNAPAPPSTPPVQQTTFTFWYSDSGSENSKTTTCENPGGGQTGTYLGGGWCQINTPPGSSVQAPQNGNSWSGPYDGVNGNLLQ